MPPPFTCNNLCQPFGIRFSRLEGEALVVARFAAGFVVEGGEQSLRGFRSCGEAGAVLETLPKLGGCGEGGKFGFEAEEDTRP